MAEYTALQIVDWLRARNFSDMRMNENVEPLTQMKAMKLLYFAQGLMLAAYNKKLFKEPLVAWKYGPVVKSVHEKYAGKKGIVKIDENNNGNLGAEAQKNYDDINKDIDAATVLDTVMDVYGDMTAIELMNLTHDEGPWKDCYPNGTLDETNLKKFFKENVLAE